jgi:hypothetical protein
MAIFTAMGSALYSKLAAGAALTSMLGGTAIYDTLAPQTQPTPWVVFFHSAGGDDNTSPRRARSLVYTVKAVSTVGSLEAGEIDDLVDTLLHEQTLTVTGWGNYWMARVADIAYTEESGGVLFWHRGGQYRIRIAET